MGIFIRKSILYILSVVVVFFCVVFSEAQERVLVADLLYDIGHPDAERRRKAIVLLGRHEIRQAVPALIKATEDEDKSIRLESLRALVRIQDMRALQTYIRLVGDDRKVVQLKAIEGIVGVYVGQSGNFSSEIKKILQFDDYNPAVVESYIPVSEDAIASLVKLLSSLDSKIREEASGALGALRARSVIPAIEKALEREVNDQVKVELIRSIYKIGDRLSGEILIPFILDSDKKVHDEAIFALGRLGVKKAVPQLKALYDSGVEESRKILGVIPISGKDDLQRKVFEALAYIGDPSTANLFVNGLQDERDFYRRCGAEGLGRMGDPAYVTEVARKYLRESSEAVKLAMGFAIFLMGRDEHLVEMIDNVLKEQVFHYFLELNPQDIKKLYSHIESEKPKIRVALLEIVGLRGDQSALTIVERMAKHPNLDISASASLAARRLHGP